jgi:hypothetical protein
MYENWAGSLIPVVLNRYSMDPLGAREIYYVQTQNTCKHWKYIVRIICNNDVVYITMIYKNIFNNFSNVICNSVLGDRIHSYALNSAYQQVLIGVWLALYVVVVVLIMIIIISGSTVLIRTLAASLRRFRNLVRHTVGLLWTSGQPVAKISPYTGQHNI